MSEANCKECGKPLMVSTTGVCDACRLKKLAVFDVEDLDTPSPSDTTEFIPSDAFHKLKNIASSDKYRIIKRVGVGGMGDVYEAEDRVFGRRVALKKLRKGLLQEELLNRFVHEAKITSMLNHPNIVPIYDLIEHEGDLFYTMRLMEGDNLREILNRLRKLDRDTIAAYPLDRLLEVFGKICDAMSYAHHQGVLHRDLKPSNVMVGKFGEVMVLDWGLAVDLNQGGAHVNAPSLFDEEEPDTSGFLDDMSDAEMMGSLHYMSPEQICSDPKAMAIESDIFSLGAILYHCVTLTKPFESIGRKEIIRLNLEAELPDIHSLNEKVPGIKSHERFPHLPGPSISPQLYDVVRKAMSRMPAERYTSAIELKRDVDLFRGGRVPSAGNSTLWTRALFLLKRKRNVSLLSSSFLLVMALFWLWNELKIVEERRGYFDREWKLEYENSFDEPLEEHGMTGWDVTKRAVLSYKDGVLRMESHKMAHLRLKKAFASDIKVTFDAWVPEKGTVPYQFGVKIGDGPETAIKIELASLFNNKLALNRNGFNVKNIYRSLEKLHRKRSYVITKVGGRLQLLQDNAVVLNYEEENMSFSETQKFFSLYCDFGEVHFDNLKIYRLSLPKKVDLFDMALQVKESGSLDNARKFFREAMAQGEDAKGVVYQLLEVDEALRDFGVENKEQFRELLNLLAEDEQWLAISDPEKRFYFFKAFVCCQILSGQLSSQDNAYYLSKVITALQGRFPVGDFLNRHLAKEIDVEWISIRDYKGKLDFLRRFKPKILELINCQVGSLSVLEGASVEKLSLRRSHYEDIEALRKLPLKELDLAKTETKKLDALAGMKLKAMYIEETQVVDFSPLQGMPIVYLYADQLNKANLSSLSKMPLHYLMLSKCRNIDYRFLKPLGAANLSLSHSDIKDLRVLEAIPMRVLFLDGIQVEDFSPLAKIKSLKSLFLSGTRILDLSPLTSLELRSLDLSSTGIADLTGLSHMPLDELRLDHSKVKSLDSLKGVDLISLSMSGTGVTSLEPLAKMSRFQELIANHASIDSLDALSGLDMKVIEIGHTGVSDLSVLASMKNLEKLRLDNSHIKSLGPLKNTSLKELYMLGIKVDDLRPLLKLPLSKILITPHLYPRKLSLLRNIKSLRKINGVSTELFWERYTR